MQSVCNLQEISHVWYCIYIITVSYRLGVVACSCNPAAWSSGLVDGLRAGALSSGDPCRSGVRAKQGINMVSPGEPRRTRLSKEGRTGPGWKHSRQKSPCSAVAGSRPWIGTGWQPVQYNGTQSFFFGFFFGRGAVRA